MTHLTLKGSIVQAVAVWSLGYAVGNAVGKAVGNAEGNAVGNAVGNAGTYPKAVQMTTLAVL